MSATTNQLKGQIYKVEGDFDVKDVVNVIYMKNWGSFMK